MSEKIQPFSNLTEFISWKDRNCDKCCRYENTSTNIKNARCRLSFHLDLASVSDGTISTRTALKIGTIEYNGIDGSCILKARCNNFNKPLPARSKPKKKEDINQQKLFIP